MPRRTTRQPLTWEQKYYSMNRQRAFAWAKYFEVVAREHEQAYDHYVVIRNITTNELNEYVKKQLIEMGEQLKKTWECPVCLEFIEKQNLDITPCGHYYCKPCLAEMKKRPDEDGEVKCGICRHKLHINPNADG